MERLLRRIAEIERRLNVLLRAYRDAQVRIKELEQRLRDLGGR